MATINICPVAIWVSSLTLWMMIRKTQGLIDGMRSKAVRGLRSGRSHFAQDDLHHPEKSKPSDSAYPSLMLSLSSRTLF